MMSLQQVSDFRDSLALLAELKTVLQHRRKPGDPEPSADDEDYDRPMEPDLPRRRYED